MRIAIIIAACLTLIAGMWIAGLAFYEDPADPMGSPSSGVVSAPRQGPGGKVAVGMAMIGGGVMLLYLGTRR